MILQRMEENSCIARTRIVQHGVQQRDASAVQNHDFVVGAGGFTAAAILTQQLRPIHDEKKVPIAPVRPVACPQRTSGSQVSKKNNKWVDHQERPTPIPISVLPSCLPSNGPTISQRLGTDGQPPPPTRRLTVTRHPHKGGMLLVLSTFFIYILNFILHFKKKKKEKTRLYGNRFRSLFSVKWMPWFLVAVSDMAVGANAYDKMPDGCKGKHWESGHPKIWGGVDRSCYPRKAVDDWIAGGTLKDSVVATYGLIKNWDMSEVTDMFCLFQNMDTFTSDISKWDVSGVTTMRSST